MPDEVESLLKRVILDEIAGKNQAIYAYDKMIWTIRTGFFTLVFGGYGFLLSSVADSLSGIKGADPSAKAWSLIAAMAVISGGIALTAFIVDLSYVRRKFRVISALNHLMSVAIEHDAGELASREWISEHLRPLLSVSGDSGSRDYASLSGYGHARTICLIVYLLSMIAVTMAVALLAMSG